MSKITAQYSSQKLKKFKSIITEKLDVTQEELATIQQNQKNQKQHLANTNVDFNENSKHFQQQAKDKQFIRRLQRKSRELRAALNRIENKSYGVCNRTGQLIREERLMAMPTAQFDIPSTK